MIIRIEDSRLFYLVDCNLVTLAHACEQTRRKKFDIKRHVGIAQIGVSLIKDATNQNIPNIYGNTRTVLNGFGGDVAKWCAFFAKERGYLDVMDWLSNDFKHGHSGKKHITKKD